jgi:hypothetical protein
MSKPMSCNQHEGKYPHNIDARSILLLSVRPHTAISLSPQSDMRLTVDHSSGGAQIVSCSLQVVSGGHLHYWDCRSAGLMGRGDGI